MTSGKWLHQSRIKFKRQFGIFKDLWCFGKYGTHHWSQFACNIRLLEIYRDGWLFEESKNIWPRHLLPSQLCQRGNIWCWFDSWSFSKDAFPSSPTPHMSYARFVIVSLKYSWLKTSQGRICVIFVAISSVLIAI